MKIGKTIRELRKRKSISQTDFSASIGITQTSLSKIEADITYPHDSTIKKIIKVLDIPEHFLYLLSATVEDVPKKKKPIFKILYPTIRQLIFSIIDEHDSP